MFSRLEWGAGGALPGHTSLVRIKAWYDRRARPLEKDTEARGRGRPVPHAPLGTRLEYRGSATPHKVLRNQHQ